MKNIFTFKGNEYQLHYDAYGYGVYGITARGEEIISFISSLKKNTAHYKAYKYAIDNQIDKYPIQDDIWPSRRWNEAKTNYIDLSN